MHVTWHGFVKGVSETAGRKLLKREETDGGHAASSDLFFFSCQPRAFFDTELIQKP